MPKFKNLARFAIAATSALAISAPTLAWSATVVPAAPTAAEAATLARAQAKGSLVNDSIYFVMTDRYANGDTSNDHGGIVGGSISTDGFDPTSDSYYHGGDLKGLTGGCTTGTGLARIHNMGFTALWVTPPFKQKYVQGDSAAYHGYWITDFLNIDPHWGTNADFKAMVDCAHSLGMKVILDIVMNHTADVIQYKNNGTAYIPTADANAKNPAWLNKLSNYHNRGNVSDWSDKWWYQMGDFFGLDDIATENAEVVSGFADVYSQWVNNYGVDAFRIDTAKHVDDNFFAKWWPKVQALTKANKPSLTAFGEFFDGNIDTLSGYVRNRGIPSALDFGFEGDAVAYAGGDGDAGNLMYVLNQDDKYNAVGKSVYNLVTFLGNHDMGRVGYNLLHSGATAATLLQADLFAHDLMFLNRGTPTVYYGDEVGMIGWGGDKAAREDMFATQVGEWKSEPRVTGGAIGTNSSLTITDNPIMKRITDLNALRAKYPALASGAEIFRNADGGALAVSRIDASDRREFLVGFNSANKDATLTFTTSSPASTFKSVWGVSDDVVSDASGSVTIKIPAHSSIVLRSESQLPPATVAVKPVLTYEFDTDHKTVNLTAALNTQDPATVSFALKMPGAKTWTYIGSDDSASFRLYWDYTKALKGKKIAFAAISKTTGGAIAVSNVKLVTIP